MWSKVKQKAGDVQGVILTVSVVVFVIVFFRLLGLFQPLEWTVLDIFFKLRPSEVPDKRIIIVAIEETDIKKLKQYPISDKVIATTLTKINQQQPRAIGLDIVRDIPVNPGHQELVRAFKTTPNLWGIEKVIGDEHVAKVDAPPVLKKLGQVATIDTITDGDGVVRRTLLFPKAEDKESIPSLGLAVAMTYLEKQGIIATSGEDGYLQLGKTLFVPLKANNEGRSNDGGYININAGGYQILLNYRGPANSFDKVSLVDLLEDKLPPQLMRDRIVLIGYEAASVKDNFLTPYSLGIETTPIRTSGVEYHANIASMVLSSVLDNRPLLKFLSEPLEYFLIVLGTGIIPLLTWKWQNQNTELFLVKYLPVINITFLISFLGLIASSYLAFLVGWWIPVVQPIVGLFVSSIVMIIYTFASKMYQSYLSALESESRFRLATNAARMEIVKWDLENDQIIISNNLSMFVGKESKFLTSNKKDIFSFIHIDDRNRVDEAIQLAIKNKIEYSIEFRVPKKGEDVWIKAKGGVFCGSDGLATKISGVLWDISELKRAERTIEQGDFKWQTLPENSFELIIVLRSDDWLIYYVNSSVQELLGYTKEDVLYSGFLDYVWSKDINLIVTTLENLPPNQKVTLKYKVICIDGTLRLFESTFCNLMNEPLIGGIVVNSRDITKVEQVESAYRNAIAQCQEFKKQVTDNDFM